MATKKKISELTNLAAPDGTEMIPVNSAAAPAGVKRVYTQKVADLNRITKAITADDVVTVNPGYAIRDICIQETAGHAITGGLDIGTTPGGQEVVAAKAVGANSWAFVAAASILKRLFDTGTPTILYVRAHSAWNGAHIELVMTTDRAII